MANFTLAQIRSKIENDMDLQDEDFITTSEFTDLVNEAIREAEAEIQKMGVEDEYFLASADLPLVSGTQNYSLPDDIYATKIRGLIYDTSSRTYEIKRIRGKNKFRFMAELQRYSSGSDYYRYILTNESAASGWQIKLFPAAQETSSSNVKVWYIRNAAQLVADSDECDIPEFINFIFASLKLKVAQKEIGHPLIPLYAQEKEQQRVLMVATLSEQVVDGDNEVEQDMSHYQESI